jgi:hypothetical protein
MKLKNFVPSALGVLLFLVFLVFFLMIVFYCFRKETFQDKNDKIDFMDILEKFCNEQFGDEWGIDNVFHYNDRIMFIVIHTQGAIVDVSVQPENRAIIIENIKGKSSLKKRIYRF